MSRDGMQASGGGRLSVLALAGCVVIGFLVFERSLGVRLLDPAYLDWMFSGGLDPSGHFLGWHMFRHERWHWPPGAIASFGHPIGTSIALTDSIPLVAMPLKAAAPILPPVFQYMGLWLLACFVLQAVFGAMLAAAVTRRPMLQLLWAALFALSPVLLHRIGHQALCAHWLLLAALWLYQRRPTADARPAVVAWLLLTAGVAATHPYLTIQVLAVASAAMLSGWRRPSDAAATGLRLTALVATTAVVWWLAGYFVVGTANDLQEGGFGRLSLNLAAPFIPPPDALLAGRMPFAALGHEQLEGYSYFGLGALLVVALALLLVRPSLSWLRIPRHRLFALACLGLTLLALSPTVTFGTHVLLEYDPAWWGPLSVFRSSGRLFWLVYYAIVWGGATVVTSHLSYRWAAAALGAAVLLQAVDMTGPQRASRAMRELASGWPLTSEIWTVLPGEYQHFVMYPTNMCTVNPGIDYRFPAVLAGTVGATINAGYAGRYDVARLRAYCQDLEATVANGSVSDDSLYLLEPSQVPRLLGAATPIACTPADGYGLCFTVESYARWRDRWDLVRRSLPDSEDLTRFRERLEAEYRDRMRRPSAGQAGSMAERLDAMAAFLAYRANGCDYDEALAHASTSTPDTTGLCRRPTFGRHVLPPAGEALQARQAIESRWAQSGRPPSPSHVDPVGEAVWLHAYIARRLDGQAAAQATAEVLQAIRAIAP